MNKDKDIWFKIVLRYDTDYLMPWLYIINRNYYTELESFIKNNTKNMFIVATDTYEMYLKKRNDSTSYIIKANIDKSENLLKQRSIDLLIANNNDNDIFETCIQEKSIFSIDRDTIKCIRVNHHGLFIEEFKVRENKIKTSYYEYDNIRHIIGYFDERNYSINEVLKILQRDNQNIRKISPQSIKEKYRLEPDCEFYICKESNKNIQFKDIDKAIISTILFECTEKGKKIFSQKIDASDLKTPLYTLYIQFMQENQFFNNLCYPYQLTVNKSFKKI